MSGAGDGHGRNHAAAPPSAPSKRVPVARGTLVCRGVRDNCCGTPRARLVRDLLDCSEVTDTVCAAEVETINAARLQPGHVYRVEVWEVVLG